MTIGIPKSILYLALASVCISASYSFYYRVMPWADAQGYDQIALNLVGGYGYVEKQEFAITPEKDEALIRVGPGYQFFLAAIYFLFGHHYFIVWLLQALLRGASVIALYLLVREMLPNYRAAAFWAAVLFVFIPDLIVISGMLLAETLLLFLLVAATYFSVLLLKHERFSYAWMASVLWGGAALVRPTAFFMVLLLAMLLAWKRRWIFTVVIFLCPILFLGGWSVRNSIVYGKPLFTTTAGSYSLWVGNNSNATGGFDKTLEIQEARGKYHSVELDSISRQKYVAFLVQEPLQFTALQLRKTALYFSLLRPTGFWAYIADRPWHTRITLVASFFGTLLLFVLGIAGWLSLISQRNLPIRFLLALAFIQPFLVIPTYVETRYKYPLYPLLAICAGFFIEWRFGTRWCLAAAIIFLLFFTGYDLTAHFADISEKVRRIL